MGDGQTRLPPILLSETFLDLAERRLFLSSGWRPQLCS